MKTKTENLTYESEVVFMSTYYEYRDVKVMIAHKLMNIEGWKVYGYKWRHIQWKI